MKGLKKIRGLQVLSYFNICKCGKEIPYGNQCCYSHSNLGRKQSEEWRRNNSNAKKGENHPNFGKHLSAHTRMRISRANTGRKRSEEYCRKQSERLKGKPSPKKGIPTGKPAWNRGILKTAEAGRKQSKTYKQRFRAGMITTWCKGKKVGPSAALKAWDTKRRLYGKSGGNDNNGDNLRKYRQGRSKEVFRINLLKAWETRRKKNEKTA